MPSELLDRGRVLTWASRAVRLLEEFRDGLNAANVFPVADSDTGTNMLLTLRSGLRCVEGAAAGGSGADAMGAFARGALLGARGNSGIILSEFLRGFALGLPGAVGGQGVAACLTRAAQCARAAVAEPVGGTILTAADDAAAAAVAAAGTDEAAPVLAAYAAAVVALERSPQDLGVLADHGVVDSGAFGLTLVLRALASQWVAAESLAPLTGGPAGLGAADVGSGSAAGCGNHPQVSQPGAEVGGCAHFDGEFEVMFVLEHDQDPRPALLGHLNRVGSSVVVVGGDGVWQVHVHTDHPQRAVLPVAGGRMRQVCVRHLAAPGDAAPVVRRPGIVVGASSPGLIAEFARAGAIVLMRGDEPWQADEAERAIVDAGTSTVVVLAPTGPDAHAARTAAQDLAATDVVVVDTPTELHATVALTAAAELLDAFPSREAGSGRDASDLITAIRRAITDLGTVAQMETGDTGATGELQAGELGLVLVLHPSNLTGQELADLRTRISSTLGEVEYVMLDSGITDSHLLIGAL